MDEKDVKTFIETLDTYEKILVEAVDEVLEEELKNTEFEDYVSSPLSPSVPKAQVKQGVKQVLRNLFLNDREGQRITEGVRIVRENLDQVSGGELAKKELNQAADRLGSFILGERELDETQNLEETSLATLLGISFQSCMIFYEIGLKLYEEQRFEEAISVFAFLSILESYCQEIWVALGLCHQQLEEWLFAVNAYSMANLIKPEDPLPYLHSAQCFLACNEVENAKGSLKLAEYFLSTENRNDLEPLFKSLTDHL
jgi:tetratricopeptide (TPR) repeat protein